MKKRAILDQIARITYIADMIRVARFRSVLQAGCSASLRKKGADSSTVGRMLSKNLRDDFDATSGRAATTCTRHKVALLAPGCCEISGPRATDSRATEWGQSCG